MVVTVPVHPSQVTNGVATPWSQAHVQVVVVPENRQSTMFCLCTCRCIHIQLQLYRLSSCLIRKSISCALMHIDRLTLRTSLCSFFLFDTFLDHRIHTLNFALYFLPEVINACGTSSSKFSYMPRAKTWPGSIEMVVESMHWAIGRFTAKTDKTWFTFLSAIATVVNWTGNSI